MANRLYCQRPWRQARNLSFPTHTLLTNNGDDRGSEEESAGKLPLYARPMRHVFLYRLRNVLERFFADVELGLEFRFLLFELRAFNAFLFRLQSVEHGGTHQQVRKCTHDQRQRTHVLLLHDDVTIGGSTSNDVMT